MATSQLDRDRLALRIERLQRTATHGWDSGDELEFKNLLPTGRDRRRVPDPNSLREKDPEHHEWVLWVAVVTRMESLAHQNEPERRALRDMTSAVRRRRSHG